MELEARREGTLLAKARGAERFFAAWRALDRKEDGAVRAHLAEACHLLPELSREPDLVENALCFLPSAHEPGERLQQLSSAARLWPEPCSDTALFLRLMAVVVALRRTRPRAAASLLRGWPLRSTPDFVRRCRPAMIRRMRSELDARRDLASRTISKLLERAFG